MCYNNAMSDLFRIRDVVLDNSIIVGPMAGVSNQGFREMIREFNPGLIYSEMVSDKAITFKNRKTAMMTVVGEDEPPITMQLFGHEIESMTQAARYLDTMTNCTFIDINMGCPVPKVANNGSGSALMKDPEYAAELVKAIVDSVNKPVTVKIRSGWDDSSINVVEMSQLLEKSGISALCVHPRTRTQFYSGHSDWSLIKAVKEKLSIPVIGNGDIKTVEDMIRMKEETGCDAFMVSRGCLGNPWLIQQLVQYEKTGEIIEGPTPEERLLQCLYHAQRLINLKGERVAIKEMRGHACWYINGLPNNNRVKALINNITRYEQLDYIMNSYREALKTEDYRFLDEGKGVTK